MKDLVRELEVIACDAARLIVEVRERGVDVLSKGDGSPVTEADARSEALILERLGKSFAGVPVVAEELCAANRLPDVSGGRFFLVDPLDGTKEFIKGTPEYTVNIALIEAGVPIAGVVVAPGRGDVFSGFDARAQRSRIVATGAPEGHRDVKVRQPGAGWAAVVSVSHITDETRAFLDRLPISERVSIGSSLKFCLLACGEADIYPRLGRTMQWDTAAGDAVLRAAGGSTVTRDGAPLRYGPRPGAVENRYENPHFVAVGGPVGLDEEVAALAL